MGWACSRVLASSKEKGLNMLGDLARSKEKGLNMLGDLARSKEKGSQHARGFSPQQEEGSQHAWGFSPQQGEWAGHARCFSPQGGGGKNRTYKTLFIKIDTRDKCQIAAMPKLKTSCSRVGSVDRVEGVYFVKDHDCIARLGLDIELNFYQPTDY